MRQKLLLFLTGMLLFSSAIWGQTITTVGALYTATNSGGAPGAITFAVTNANSYPINITEAGTYLYSTDAAATFTLWYHPSQLTGAPGAIATTGGWVQIASSATPVTASVNGIANVITGMTFTIPANTTYRMAMTSTVTMHYSGSASVFPTPNTFTTNGVSLLVGDNTVSPGYAGIVTSLPNSPRAFTGQITFAPAISAPPACVSAPLAPPNNATTICSGTTTLRWNKVSGAASYDVYLNTGTGTPTTIVSAAQVDTFYNATTIVSPYVWKIVPKNILGDATGCATFNFTTILGTTPSVSIVSNKPDTICPATPVTFTATPVNGGSGPVYQWKKNNINVGTNSPTYTDNTLVNNDGIKVVMTSNSTGCLVTNTATSNTKTIRILTPPAITVTAGGPTAFCTGGSVTLSTTAVGTSYQWVSNGSPIPNTNTTSYVAMYNGYYKVLVTSTSFNCAYSSDSILVTVYALPFPRVNRTSNTLSTEAIYATYQWYKGIQPIAGATTDSYTFTNDGQYSIRVTDMAGCTGSSAAVPVNNLAVNGVNANDVSIYPNPAKTIVFINAPVKVNAAIRSIEGKVVLYKENASQIDISNLANGIYSLSITDKENRTIRIEKLVKAAE